MNTKLVCSGAVLVLVALYACNSRSERPPDAQRLMTRGHTVFVEYCAECHQTDGTGWSNLYPRLAGNPIVTLHDPAPIIEIVTYRQGSMTGFSQKISSDDIAAVLTYIRNSWGNNAAPVSARQIH